MRNSGLTSRFFTSFSEFLGFSFNPDDQAAYLPFLSVTINCFAADFIYDDGTIYFTDDGKNVIGRVNTDGSGLEYVLTKGLNRPHGIAVDWVARNMYWTDMGTKLIEVRFLCSLRFLFCFIDGIIDCTIMILLIFSLFIFYTQALRLATSRPPFVSLLFYNVRRSHESKSRDEVTRRSHETKSRDEVTRRSHETKSLAYAPAYVISPVVLRLAGFYPESH